MTYKLIPPPEQCDNSLANATPQECISAWIRLRKEHELKLLAQLREEIGPDGDLKAAHRKWYEKQCEEHTQHLIHMLSELHRRESDSQARRAEQASSSKLPSQI